MMSGEGQDVQNERIKTLFELSASVISKARRLRTHSERARYLLTARNTALGTVGSSPEPKGEPENLHQRLQLLDRILSEALTALEDTHRGMGTDIPQQCDEGPQQVYTREIGREVKGISAPSLRHEDSHYGG